jgi:dTDP-4-amino-4,6-dideoxygalactose transaminase
MIPFSKPSITQEEIDEVNKVLNSSWLTVGPKVKEFESALGKYLGAENVVATDSCTSALTLSSVSLRGGEYARALIPALTFVATANAAYHAGYDIEFCDVGQDGNLDPSRIDDINLLNRNYDLIVPVHFAGQVCDLESISKHGNTLIEDAAHAIGAKYAGVSVGLSDFSNGACFSFYPTKNMTTAEGGAFVSTNEFLVENVRKLSLHGLDASHINRYERSSLARPVVSTPGYKANMTDVEAAIGIVQMGRLHSFMEKRKRVSSVYMQELEGRVEFLKLNGRDHVWHMFVIMVDNRDDVVSKLREKGVGAGIHYSPIIPAHPFYAKETNYWVGKYPNAEYISRRCISLPLFNDISDDEVDRVIRSVKELV